MENQNERPETFDEIFNEKIKGTLADAALSYLNGLETEIEDLKARLEESEKINQELRLMAKDIDDKMKEDIKLKSIEKTENEYGKLIIGYLREKYKALNETTPRFDLEKVKFNYLWNVITNMLNIKPTHSGINNNTSSISKLPYIFMDNDKDVCQIIRMIDGADLPLVNTDKKQFGLTNEMVDYYLSQPAIVYTNEYKNHMYFWDTTSYKNVPYFLVIQHPRLVEGKNFEHLMRHVQYNTAPYLGAAALVNKYLTNEQKIKLFKLIHWNTNLNTKAFKDFPLGTATMFSTLYNVDKKYLFDYIKISGNYKEDCILLDDEKFEEFIHYLFKEKRTKDLLTLSKSLSVTHDKKYLEILNKVTYTSYIN